MTPTVNTRTGTHAVAAGLEETPPFRSAMAWAMVALPHASRREQVKFAEDYAAAIEEIPPNFYPDRPVPTPADFEDDNWLDYHSAAAVGLVDVTTSGLPVAGNAVANEGSAFDGENDCFIN